MKLYLIYFRINEMALRAPLILVREEKIWEDCNSPTKISFKTVDLKFCFYRRVQLNGLSVYMRDKNNFSFLTF